MLKIWDFIVRLSKTIVKIDELIAQIKSFFDEE